MTADILKRTEGKLEKIKRETPEEYQRLVMASECAGQPLMSYLFPTLMSESELTRQKAEVSR